jgi:prophage antirepressor-like protein
MAAQLAPSVHALNNPFLFADHEIRTALGDDGEAWFCAKDVFEALGIIWKGAKGSLTNCPEKWQVVCYLQTSHGVKDAIFISEPAVYQTAFISRKPDAVRFTEWVCEEVLPAIRRQGYFGTLTAGQQIALRAQKLKLLDKLNTKDAFMREAVLTSLRNVCNQLGEPMPDVGLLGKDTDQLSLEV